MREWVSPTICAGLELEYEDVSVNTSSDAAMNLFPDGHYLEFKRDGSLRPRDRSTEIIFAAPLSGNKIDEALYQIDELVRSLPYTISWRCGMHAHIDCRGMGWDIAFHAFILSSLIEPLLYAWDGTGRKENKFCQSIVDSAGAFIQKNGSIQFTKYSLVNALSLGSLGSLELRFAACTKNVDRMAEYINLGMALRICGESFPTSEIMLESMMGARSMAHWLLKYVPGHSGAHLAKIAEQLGYEFPNSSAILAATTLAEKEPKLQNNIVGGRGRKQPRNNEIRPMLRPQAIEWGQPVRENAIRPLPPAPGPRLQGLQAEFVVMDDQADIEVGLFDRPGDPEQAERDRLEADIEFEELMRQVHEARVQAARDELEGFIP